jgi:hypothetical protein
MKVTLSSVGNPDYGQYYGKNVLSPTVQVKVRDFAEASKVCRAYIAKYDLGGGNWTGGIICQERIAIARVSYNGRVWPVGKWNPYMRPLYDPERSAK